MSVSKGKKGGRIINIASMAGLMEGTYVPGMYVHKSWKLQMYSQTEYVNKMRNTVIGKMRFSRDDWIPYVEIWNCDNDSGLC